MTDNEHGWNQVRALQARLDAAREAMVRFLGIDPHGRDKEGYETADEKLEEAGRIAGREWAHGKQGDFRELQRVVTALDDYENGHDSSYGALAAVIAGFKLEDETVVWDNPKVRATIAATQHSLIPYEGEYSLYEGPGFEWTYGFEKGVREVWEETRDWLAENALRNLSPPPP